MLASPHTRSRWVLVGAAALSMVGCAAPRGLRTAHSEGACPISFTLLCEARQPGGPMEPSQCRCVRHKDIGAWMNRD